MTSQIENLKNNFGSLGFSDELSQKAINHIKYWLVHPEFEVFQSEIEYLITSEKFTELFDAFYQVIPFGTGGRRGKVGIGYNRINKWTIAAAAQGHSQFLLNTFGEEAKSRGIVIAYDVRQYTQNTVYSHDARNPIWGLTSKDFGEIAATVYAKNNIKVHFFREVRSTPQLSFTIRQLNAVAGINISASHNPPEYNGLKVYNADGGQLLPPNDEALIKEVNEKVNIYDVDWGIFEEEVKKGAVVYVTDEIEQAYISAAKSAGKDPNRSARILFSPLHGTGKTSIYKVMKQMGFDVHIHPDSGIPSGEFEYVPNQIANPELPEVYNHLIPYAEKIDADIIITSDPDADRMGISTRKKDEYIFLNGNEVCTLLVHYLSEVCGIKAKHVLTTIPVTRLVSRIAGEYGLWINDRLIPGFKYIAQEMNRLESEGDIDSFLIGMEDTLGHLAGTYARDKDGCTASILLSEYAGILKDKGSSLSAELEGIYNKYGYFLNHTEYVVFNYSFEMDKINSLMDKFRNGDNFIEGNYQVREKNDLWVNRQFVSETDKVPSNVIEIILEDDEDTQLKRVIVRPSGTEPKLKVYFEIGMKTELELEEARDKAHKKLETMLEQMREWVGLNDK